MKILAPCGALVSDGSSSILFKAWGCGCGGGNGGGDDGGGEMGGNVKQATAGSECVTIYRLQAYNRKDGRAGR
jgi:hypothetical protein